MSDNLPASRSTSSPWQQPLLRFAEQLYACPAVEKNCLHLQDKYQVNVNILLWTFWLHNENLAVGTHYLDDVLINIDASSQLTVSRLREIRRLIKNTNTFTKVQAQQVCKHILQAELKAERIFLQRLEDLSKRFIGAGGMERVRETISPRHYLDFLGVPEAQVFIEEISLYLQAVKN